MIRIDRVVTRTGDDGGTALGDGSRVRKDALRVEAYGTVDEANAALGLLRALLPDGAEATGVLLEIQNRLFDLGGDLCIPQTPETEAAPYRLDDRLLALLDRETKRLADRQAPLDSFILPGGTAGAAQAHVARTIVRRAERRVVTLAASEPVNPRIVRALNRLSDYLFVLARHLNGDGKDDLLWQR